jgi:hypothetical protein
MVQTMDRPDDKALYGSELSGGENRAGSRSCPPVEDAIDDQCPGSPKPWVAR